MGDRRRVLVVEDEPIIAWDIESELSDRGYDVVGPAGRSDLALQLIADEQIDIAVLDINLGRDNSFSIARDLRDRGIPFVFLTGDSSMRPDEFDTVPVLTKPIDYSKLAVVLAKQLDAVSGN